MRPLRVLVASQASRPLVPAMFLERSWGELHLLPSLCLCPPQATYVLLALAWVFVPIYISSEVSPLPRPQGGLTWVRAFVRLGGADERESQRPAQVGERTHCSQGWVTSPADVPIDSRRQAPEDLSPGALSAGSYCPCLLHRGMLLCLLDHTAPTPGPHTWVVLSLTRPTPSAPAGQSLPPVAPTCWVSAHQSRPPSPSSCVNSLSRCVTTASQLVPLSLCP